MAPLAIGLSLAVDITLIISFVTELVRSLPGLELRFVRGTGPEIAELLKKGDIEVALAGSLGETWDRLESWALFTEPYKLVVGAEHPLRRHAGGECRGRRQGAPGRARALRAPRRGDDVRRRERHAHRIPIKRAPNPMSRLFCNPTSAFSIMPQSSAGRLGVRSLDLEGFNVNRTVCVYGVSGRQRSMAASTFIKMLRAADWSTIEPQSRSGVSKVA